MSNRIVVIAVVVAVVAASGVAVLFAMRSNDPPAGQPRDAAITQPASQDEVVLRFKVTGMDCTGCEASIKDAVKGIDGVIACDASYKTGDVTVTASNPQIEPQVAQAISDAGYTIDAGASG